MTFGIGQLTPEILADLAEHPLDRADRERAEHIARMDAEDREPDGTHRDWLRTVEYVRYDPATGRITGLGKIPLAAFNQLQADHPETGYLLARAEMDTHWVDVRRGRVRLKSRCPARADGPYLRELPVPCLLTITDEVGEASEHECDTGYLDLSGSDPGTYRVTVESVPHLSETYEVVVP